jgi:hypothetical protein
MRKALDPTVVSGIYADARKAYCEGHFLEAAIVAFQSTELSLRRAIVEFGKLRKIHEDVPKKLGEDEQSFLRLTYFLELLYPDHELAETLRRLNTMRNKFIHSLFHFQEPTPVIRAQAKSFCGDADRINAQLADMGRIYWCGKKSRLFPVHRRRLTRAPTGAR